MFVHLILKQKRHLYPFGHAVNLGESFSSEVNVETKNPRLREARIFGHHKSKYSDFLSILGTFYPSVR